MKKLIYLIVFTLTLQAGYTQKTTSAMKKSDVPTTDNKAIRDAGDRNNDFYDNEETFLLPVKELYIGGEIENPGMADFTKLAKHSVIVKEALLNKDTGNQFVGAYRYDGYSLFDLLKDRVLKKKNALEFRPIIDVYVEIENELGEKVVMSWGEIYYPNVLHNIIIATEVMRIVPSKTKDLWPLPTTSKLVVAGDLISERNIRNPVKITVISYPREYKVTREMTPLFSETVNVFVDDQQIDWIRVIPADLQTETLHTIFYGKGRGIHSTQPFSGAYLKDYLADKTRFNRKYLRSALVVLAGIDGYRSVYSFSEIMNRNDQSEVLIVPCPEDKDGGKFRIFPSCDFFSDRAVKALSEIRVEAQ
jgi:hypothetical protein